MMSQKLAVSNSHQHSLVMSWNTSMLHSRPEAQQGRTLWLQDTSARSCIQVCQVVVGSKHLHFVKAQSVSVWFLFCLSVFPTDTCSKTCPHVNTYSDVHNYSITATTGARPFQVANKHFLLSHHHSSTDDGRSNPGQIHPSPPIQSHVNVREKAFSISRRYLH